MGAVPCQLVNQAKLPIKIGLHRGLGVVGALIGALVTIDPRAGQIRLTLLG